MPFAFATGVKTSRAMSLAAITWPAITTLPLNVSVPAEGDVSMRTFANTWPASASVKPKTKNCCQPKIAKF